MSGHKNLPHSYHILHKPTSVNNIHILQTKLEQYGSPNMIEKLTFMRVELENLSLIINGSTIE